MRGKQRGQMGEEDKQEKKGERCRNGKERGNDSRRKGKDKKGSGNGEAKEEQKICMRCKQG